MLEVGVLADEILRPADPIAPVLEVLTRENWTVSENEHHTIVDALTVNHRQRNSRGAAHPVEDFLFTYYQLRPSQLRRWHAGAGIALADADERLRWPFYRRIAIASDQAPAPTVKLTTADIAAFSGRHPHLLAFVTRLLQRTARADPFFGCFGLHEWAMVYRDGGARRHRGLPLRLGVAGTDDVVDSHQIRCSHHDAFRFFTAAARPRNALQPGLADRTELEQGGCLHTGMDLYKWSYRLLPLVPSSLVVRCFLLARQIRELDMRASPYDLTEFGYSPVAIETPAGKAEYVAGQRRFAGAAAVLRAELLAALDGLMAAAGQPR